VRETNLARQIIANDSICNDKPLERRLNEGAVPTITHQKEAIVTLTNHSKHPLDTPLRRERRSTRTMSRHKRTDILREPVMKVTPGVFTRHTEAYGVIENDPRGIQNHG
jgi:hypothetical protein